MTIEQIIEAFEGKPDRHLLHKILENQYFLTLKIEKIMGQFEDFTAALDKLDTDIQGVAAELAAIGSQTPAGALTADQAAALLARIAGEQGKLEALVPPTPPPAA